jgi:hypothetical protein
VTRCSSSAAAEAVAAAVEKEEEEDVDSDNAQLANCRRNSTAKQTTCSLGYLTGP